MSTVMNNVPPDAALAAHIAQFRVARRDPDAAMAAMRPILDAPPESSRERQALAEALSAAALAYAARRDIAAARHAIAAARSLVENPIVWRAVAALALAENDAASAQEAWQRVTAAEPDKGSAWMGLARACEAAGDQEGAAAAYLEAARVDPSHSTVLSVAERLTTLVPPDADTATAAAVRIAIIGSSTLDHVRSYLNVACRQAHLRPRFYVGPFDQYAQDILDSASPLYEFAPDVIVMAVHGRALFPTLYDNPFDLDAGARRAAVDDIVEQIAHLLTHLTTRTTALVVLHTFATPQYSPLGILDRRDVFGQSALFEAINGGLAERIRRDFPSVHLLDEDRVYGRIGKGNVTDPRMWFLARIGWGSDALTALTQEYMRFIKAVKGHTRKCLVLDLDNTLWGGVVGEDGPDGIALGHDAPGNAFLAFQEVILNLWKRGVILAINSKNNEADALAVLERHPDMILRPHHFAAMRINWLDKATNLESIAAELNIGLDSMVFVDDNPAECALVRGRLPQVLTVELPRDPAAYRSRLLALTDFETLNLTDEDRARGQLYAQKRERQEWETKHTGNLDDYLAQLQLVVEVAEADEFAIPRVAQLIGKTNQFNLTTRRYSEAQVRAFVASPDHVVYSARVRDRFGDHGLVGVAIVAKESNTWLIDTLLLSCRVLGRGVETALLSSIIAAARDDSATIVRGLFVPTPKNAPASDLYARHGFRLIHTDDESQEWMLDVQLGDVIPPAWLTLWHDVRAAIRI